MINPHTGFATFIICALMISPAVAGPDWEEITDGGGDAGRLPAVAQETIGSGDLHSISGAISAADHEDVFAINIVAPNSFSAIVALNTAVAGAADSRLWLFDDAGKGILGNDNSSAVSMHPAMGPAATDSSRAKVRTAGRYYIAVSVSGSGPINPPGGIFKLASAVEVSGPDDVGGKFAVTDWTSGAVAAGTFNYTITLVGASFAGAPPPPAVGGEAGTGGVAGGGPPACTDPHPGAGGCLDPTPGIPGCRNSACCQQVCAVNPNCCSVSWDVICAQMAQFMCEAGGPAPFNDHCNSPSPVFPGLTPFITIGATTDGPPHPLCDGGPPAQIFNDVWFAYVAPCTGDLTVSLCGASSDGTGPFVDFDAKLAVYGSLSCTPGDLQSSLLDCSDDAPGCPLFAPSLRVGVSAGQSLLIRLGSFGPSTNETGFGALFVQCVPRGGSPGCGEPEAGDCFVPHPTQGCIDETCCEAISALDRFCCDHNWDQLCVNKAQMLCAAKAGFEPGLIINEIRSDQPGPLEDPDEYFELKGLPGLPLSGVTYLVIGDGTIGDSGVIEAVINLDGQSIPPDRHFFAAEDLGTFGAAADLVTFINFTNSDNLTHLLVLDFHGSDGQDLDTNDDGELDIEPWGAVIDLIAVIESPNPPMGDSEYHYGPPVIGPQGPGMAPGHVYRCEPDGQWTMGQFNPAGGQDTPGQMNLPCKGVCSADLNGDGFVNSLDLGIQLSSWSIPPAAPGCGGAIVCPSDLNHDGLVNSLDLGTLLASWSIPPGAPGCS